MTKHLPPATAAIHAAPPPFRAKRARRSFDLHPALFALTLGGYLTFLAIMGVTFMNPEIAIPFTIFVITIVAGFVVPGLWAKVEGPQPGITQSWSEFLRDGVQTWSGHLAGRDVVAQVLIMPVMLIGWAIVIAVIRASV